MSSDRPVVNRRVSGEYSTVKLPDGMVETMWFPDDPDGKPRLVGRTRPQSIADIAAAHIATDEVQP